MSTIDPTAEPGQTGLTAEELHEIADLIAVLEGTKMVECFFEATIEVHDSSGQLTGLVTNRYEGVHYFYPTLEVDTNQES